MPMPMATTRAGASDTMHPSLRARKPLPPLSSPPTELTMAPPPSIDPAVDQSTNSPTNATATNSPTTTETKAQVEQVLRNHMRFARAFKLNDPALLMAFLDRDVILTTYDNQVVDGITAVLACLVGPKMGKLSTALHVKGTPLRSDAWQSAFVYEHGLVFKEPLYAETLTWHPQTLAITRITHTRLSNPNDAGPPKSVADVVKVVATLPHRLSLSDEDDQPSATLLRRRSSCSRSSLSMTTTTTSRSSLTHEDDMPANGIVVTRVAALTKLSPIRKRKLVNAYLTVESEAGELLWKSHVAKKQTLPVWSNVDVEIPPMEEDDFADHKLLKLPDPSTPVVLTLWDYGFFRSLRVASAHVTAAQLLQNERTGQVTVDLKPVGLSAETLQLSLSIERLGSAEWRPSMPSAKTAAGEDADTDSATAVVHKTPPTSSSSNLSLAVVVLVLLLAIVAAVVWQRSSRHAVAE